MNSKELTIDVKDLLSGIYLEERINKETKDDNELEKRMTITSVKFKDTVEKKVAVVKRIKL